jgi:hypothetical protein
VTTPEDDRGAAAGRDWPAEAAARVESFVGVLRDKTVRPVTVVVRFAVYGFALLLLLVAIVTLFSIAFVRLFDVYVFGGRVWASDVMVGGIFTLAGMFFLSRWRRAGA